MPNVSISGSRRFSSRSTSAAWRSQDASPAMMASFISPNFILSEAKDLATTSGGGSNRQTLRFAQRELLESPQRKRVHQPRQHDAAEEERAEDEEEKAD